MFQIVTNFKEIAKEAERLKDQVSDAVINAEDRIAKELVGAVTTIMKHDRSHPKDGGIVSNKIASGDFIRSLDSKAFQNGSRKVIRFFSSDPDATDIDRTDPGKFVVQPGEADIDQLIAPIARWVNEKNIKWDTDNGRIGFNTSNFEGMSDQQQSAVFLIARSIVEKGIYNERIFIRALQYAGFRLVGIMEEEINKVTSKF